MRNSLKTIVVIALGLLLWSKCVSVRVVTGEGNSYDGADKTSTGVESNINAKSDSLPAYK